MKTIFEVALAPRSWGDTALANGMLGVYFAGVPEVDADGHETGRFSVNVFDALQALLALRRFDAVRRLLRAGVDSLAFDGEVCIVQQVQDKDKNMVDMKADVSPGALDHEQMQVVLHALQVLLGTNQEAVAA